MVKGFPYKRCLFMLALSCFLSGRDCLSDGLLSNGSANNFAAQTAIMLAHKENLL